MTHFATHFNQLCFKTMFLLSMFFYVGTLALANNFQESLQQEADGMLNYARDYLMTRSKKDSENGNITRDTREDVKKVHSRAQWIAERISWHVAQKHDQRTVRDDFEQEQQFKDLHRYLENIISATENNPRAEKLLEICDTFRERYVYKLEHMIGY